MSFPWFKRSSIFYIPKSFPGWLVFLAAISFSVYTFIDIDSHSHSVSDTLINFVFILLIIGGIYTLIAYLANRTR